MALVQPVFYLAEEFSSQTVQELLLLLLLLSGIRWLGCNTGVSLSESIYSVIVNECSVFETEKE